MKVLRLFLTIFGGLGMTIGLTLVLFLFSLNLPGRPTLAEGAMRYVATTGSDGGNDCSDSGNPCRSLQHAVNVAIDGDTILLGTGEFTGSILINKSLSLLGTGQNSTSITGGGTSSAIQFDINSTSVISGITFLNGHDYEGAGVLNSGNLHVINSTFTNNTSGGAGGAIKNTGIMTINNSLIYSNTAGVGNISNQGILYISGSIIKNNLALGRGGGIFNTLGTMTISQSIISENIAKNGGGGIFNYSQLTILNSSIVSNTSNEGSTADQGGGIYNAGSLIIQNTEISGNSAYEGTGIYQDNYPSPSTTLINVSILENYLPPNIGNSLATAGITTVGGNIYVQNSIIGLNQEKNCYLGSPPSSNGSITSLGNNLADDDSCGLTVTGDIENVDPKLGNFQTYNSLWFHTLSVDSPAIDSGNNAVCPSVDIRNKLRPRDGNFDGISNCDIGAYEFILPPLQIVAPASGQINTPIDIEARVTVLTLTTPITFNWFISDQDPITNTSQYIDNVPLEWSTTGTKTITVRATGSNGFQLTVTITIEIVYMQFLPVIETPFAPEVGLWDTEDGHFYITSDRKNIDDFSVNNYIPNCGSVRIYTTELVPIVNNSFSFNNFTSYYAAGTFDSSTTSAGVYGLDNVYISPCQVYWTIPMTNWTGVPFETNFQTRYAPYEPDNPPNENLPYKVELLSGSK